MKRRGFLQVLAGIAAAVPVLAKADAPVKREGDVLVRNFGTPQETAPQRLLYTVGIDHGDPGHDFTAFCFAYHCGGETRVLMSRAVSHEDLENSTDELVHHVLDVSLYERVIILSAWQLERLAAAIAAMPSSHVTRYVE